MWLIFSISAALIFTSVNLLTRILAVKSVNPRAFSLVYSLWGVLFACSVFVLERSVAPDIWRLPPIQYVLLAAAALMYGVFERSQFIARKHIEASTLVILFRLTPVVAFAGSLIVFGESVTLGKLIGAALIIGSSLLVLHKNPQIKNAHALGIALMCAIALGLAWMLDKPASVGLPASFYSAIMWVLPVPIVIFPSLPSTVIKREFVSGGWKLALSAFLNVLGFVLYLKALSLAEASRVIPIVSSSATLVILGGIIFLNERTYLMKKLIAGVLMFIGILLLK